MKEVTKKTLKKTAGLVAIFTIIGKALTIAAEEGLLNDEGLNSDAAQELRSRNYEPIEVGGHGYKYCGATLYVTKFTAKNAKGNTVTGAVCQNLNGTFSLDID